MPTRFWCIVGAAVSAVSLSSAGEVTGVVQDAVGGRIQNAEVRLISAAARVVQYRTRTVQNGSFKIEDVQPGVYATRVEGPGFREEMGPDLIVRDGDVVETGNIVLQVASCDSPAINCDDFGLGPPEASPLRRGRIVLGRDCGVDLDEGRDRAICAEDKRVDLWFREEKGPWLELKPGSSTTLSQLTGYRCKDAKFEKAAVLTNGRGPGTELCVLTNKGHRAFVYIEEEVSNASPSIKLYYVTYK